MLKKLFVSLVVVVSSFAVADSVAVNHPTNIGESNSGLGNELISSQLRSNDSSSQNTNDLMLAIGAHIMRPMPHYEVCEAEDKSKLCYCPDSICWTFGNDCFCD